MPNYGTIFKAYALILQVLVKLTGVNGPLLQYLLTELFTQIY
jgi:hypothetical protein